MRCTLVDNKWISVKDKLPENNQTVLVWFCCLYAEYRICFYFKNSFYHNSISDKNLSKYITYWMPLPEPPNK